MNVNTLRVSCVRDFFVGKIVVLGAILGAGVNDSDGCQCGGECGCGGSC